VNWKKSSVFNGRNSSLLVYHLHGIISAVKRESVAVAVRVYDNLTVTTAASTLRERGRVVPTAPPAPAAALAGRLSQKRAAYRLKQRGSSTGNAAARRCRPERSEGGQPGGMVVCATGSCRIDLQLAIWKRDRSRPLRFCHYTSGNGSGKHVETKPA